MTSLLTIEERKALIERLVEYDAVHYFCIAIGEGAGRVGQIKKQIRKVYNKMSDAQLMSYKFEDKK